MDIVARIKAEYKKWEAGSKEREKKKLEKIYSKRAREALQHVYKMERAKRKLELAEQLAKIKQAELKRKRAENAAKKLSSGSIMSKLFDDKPKKKRRK